MNNKCTITGYKNLLFFNGYKKDIIKWDVEDKNELCAEGIINRPFDKGQMGCIFNIESIEFNQEAVDILKNIKKSRDDLGDVDIFSDTKGKSYLSWLGSPMTIKDSNIYGSNSYDISLFNKVIIIEHEISQDIIDYCTNKGIN